jgi:3-deoxy-7-phosphoheptulonate synthase
MHLLAGVCTVITYAVGRPVVFVTHSEPQATVVEYGVDPQRLLRAYADSAGAMNLVRAMHLHEASTLHEVRSVLSTTVLDARSARLVDELHHGLQFAASFGRAGRVVGLRDMYTSHQAVLLDYERQMLRTDGTPGHSRPYACSAHLLWSVPPTDGPGRVAFGFAGLIANPVGLFLGPQTKSAAAARWLARLDPHLEPGRIVLRLALGQDRVRDLLPDLVKVVTSSGHDVVWQCDPVTANAHRGDVVDAVIDETAGFIEVLGDACIPIGGLHLDLNRLLPADALSTALLLMETLRD